MNLKKEIENLKENETLTIKFKKNDDKKEDVKVITTELKEGNIAKVLDELGNDECCFIKFK